MQGVDIRTAVKVPSEAFYRVDAFGPEALCHRVRCDAFGSMTKRKRSSWDGIPPDDPSIPTNQSRRSHAPPPLL